ncbi:MAG: hypothetical protein H0X31_08630 [Nostocaceae cyanobacterium]|nr:hypothetical protein [Nostocaceae cyanobacterium]
MNVKLVNSLVEVVLNLSPEDQELFQSKLNIRQVEVVTNKKLKSTQKAEQFRQWVAQFPKSNVSLPAEASRRENIYGERGT